MPYKPKTRTIEPKSISHVLKHNGKEYKIGHTYMPYGSGACSETSFRHNLNDYDGEVIIDQLAKMPTPGDHNIYMFQVWDATDGSWYYYIANHMPYYDNNGYHEKIIYDTPMDSDNPITAFREFAEIVEPHLY